MILQTKISYKFAQKYNKVHFFSPAFDKSIVLIVSKNIAQDSLLHIDQNGEVIYQYNSSDFIDSFNMPNDRQVIVLDVENNKVKIFDLKQKKICSFMHKFKIDTSCQCHINYFCNSKLLCIRQNGNCDIKQMKLTYYHYPLNYTLPPQQNIYNQCTIYQQAWKPNDTIRKIGNHSQFLWFQSIHVDVFKLHSYSIDQNNKGNYQLLQIGMGSLISMYEINNMEAAIIQIWEIRRNELILVCATNKNERNAMNQWGVVNNTFVWDTVTSTIRESNFFFQPKYNELQIDMLGCSSFSLFHTFYVQFGKVVQSPAYFICNETETIISFQKWILSDTKKYYVAERSNNEIIQGIYSNKQVLQFNLRIIYYEKNLMMSLFLLQNMTIGKNVPTSEWDYDLASDILQTLSDNDKN